MGSRFMYACSSLRCGRTLTCALTDDELYGLEQRDLRRIGVGVPGPEDTSVGEEGNIMS